VELGVLYGVVQKSGAFYSIAGSDSLHGKDKARQWLEDNPDRAAVVEQALHQAMAQAGSRPPASPVARPSASPIDLIGSGSLADIAVPGRDAGEPLGCNDPDTQ